MAKRTKRLTKAEKIALAERKKRVEDTLAQPATFKTNRKKLPIEDAAAATEVTTSAERIEGTLATSRRDDQFLCACSKCEHASNQKVKWVSFVSTWACSECSSVTAYKGEHRLGLKEELANHIDPLYCGMF